MDKHTVSEQAYKNGYEDGKPKWISVKERLPEKSGRYLALTPSKVKGRDYFEWLIRYDTKEGFYDYDSEWGDIPMDDVTHWMPLPSPPSTEVLE